MLILTRRVGESLMIGDNVTVNKNVLIGDNAFIGEGVQLKQNVEIGDNAAKTMEYDKQLLQVGDRVAGWQAMHTVLLPLACRRRSSSSANVRLASLERA